MRTAEAHEEAVKAVAGIRGALPVRRYGARLIVQLAARPGHAGSSNTSIPPRRTAGVGQPLA
jgi:hypothetical protein